MGCGLSAPPLALVRHQAFTRKGDKPRNHRHGDNLPRDRPRQRILKDGVTALWRAKKAEGDTTITRAELFAQLRLDYEVEKSDKWVVQCWFPEAWFRGHVSGGDPCMFDMFTEVKALMSSKKMMQIRMPSDLHLWLKTYCAKHKVTMTEVVLAYLQRKRAQDEGKVKVHEL